MSPQMDFARVGARLKAAREKRGLSQDEVARTLHIRLNILQAMEADRWDSLPSVVQARGFLRLYAGLLEMDLSAPAEETPLAPPPLAVEKIAVEETRTEIKLEAPEPPAVESLSVPEPETAELEEPFTAAEPAGEPEEPETAALEFEPHPQPESGESLPRFTAAPAAKSNNPRTSRQIFQEIGQQLCDRREFLGLTLEDVEIHTHLRQRYLMALEKGDLRDLPSTVQGRGMLKNYALYLNLNEDDILLNYAEGLQLNLAEVRGIRSRPPARQQLEVKPDQQVAQPRGLMNLQWKRLLSPDLVFGSILIITFIVFMIWGGLQVVNNIQAQQEPQPTMPPVSEELRNPEVASGSVALTADAVTSTVDPNGTPQLTPTLAPPVIEETPVVNSQETATGTINLFVVARQTIWLRVVVDGKPQFSGRTGSGGSYTFSGEDQIEVITGNAAALQIFFNQQDQGSLGGVGEAIDLVFTASGLVKPTPLPTTPPQATLTPTPQTTPQATPTPGN